MGIEKQGSKGGNYVGGLLHMFDWNAKSRKKLFSSKESSPEKHKKKKWLDRNLTTTRLQMLDDEEFASGSSTKESSEYSYTSSLANSDSYTCKAPNVYAKLMGLDSLPISNILEPNSTLLSDCESVTSFCYKSKNLEYFRDTEPEYHKVAQRPIKKFQTEIVPPKSAKSTPITRHNLLPPVKSSSSVPPKDAAQIMEAAARIFEPDEKTNMPLASSTSVHLKARDSKEKVRTAIKKSLTSEPSAVKNLKGHSTNKSWNDSLDSKNKGKSISLALQAKANVQKRSSKETNELDTSKVSASRAEMSTLKKASTRNGTIVLRQNNQKQNCTADSKQSTPLDSGLQCGRKARKGDCSSARERNSSKLVGASKLASRAKDDDNKTQLSKNVSRKERPPDVGNCYRLEKNRDAENGNVVDSSGAGNVVSFTFAAPMTRQGDGSVRAAPSKRILLGSDGIGCPKKFSSPGHNNVRGGDTLSTFLGNMCLMGSDVLGENKSICTTFQFQDNISSTPTVTKRQETTLTSPYCNKPKSWEFAYIKELLSNIEPMFSDSALGKGSEIMKPHLFHRLENRKGHYLNARQNISRRLMFDCVNECLEMTCGKHFKGGYKLWAKGIWTLRRMDRLAEDVYKQISGWSTMGHLMVDQIVGNDMSSKNGTWLEYEVESFELGMQIESRVLISLIDEVVDDILVL
ncbi:hypothetical protein OROGR_014512 [Orobanche gracilis]